MSTTLAARLDSITNLETQLDALQALTDELDSHDTAIVRAVLGVFERCGHMEDFGLFGTLAAYLEAGGEDETVRALLVESIARRPAWKTLEILPGLVPENEARAILERVRDEGRLHDERFDAEYLESLLADL